MRDSGVWDAAWYCDRFELTLPVREQVIAVLQAKAHSSIDPPGPDVNPMRPPLPVSRPAATSAGPTGSTFSIAVDRTVETT